MNKIIFNFLNFDQKEPIKNNLFERKFFYLLDKTYKDLLFSVFIYSNDRVRVKTNSYRFTDFGFFWSYYVENLMLILLWDQF